MSKNKNKLVEQIRCLLDEAADLQVENEDIQRDSSAVKRMTGNVNKIQSNLDKIDELMAQLSEYGPVDPISSRDGTFTAYEKTIGMSGVDMDRIIQTGILEWFISNTLYQYLSLNLVKIRDELGMDLSGYAVRPAYKMYTVSKDEDFKYISDLLAKYRDEKREQEAGSS